MGPDEGTVLAICNVATHRDAEMFAASSLSDGRATDTRVDFRFNLTQPAALCTSDTQEIVTGDSHAAVVANCT